jgi:hypothetical protein
MWIVKGTLLSLWLFGFGTMTFFYFALYRHLQPNTAVGVSVFASLTIYNPFWWIGLVASFVVGFAITRAWAGPTGVWIALLVTGLAPAGCLTLFLVLLHTLRRASESRIR